MNKLKNILLAAIIALGFVAVAMPATTSAVNVADDCSDLAKEAQNSAICQGGDEEVSDLIKVIVNTLMFILGAVSVVVIIIAGIMYATSAGDANAVTKAKNTLLYAVVGLIVAILAYAIVNFVVGIF